MVKKVCLVGKEGVGKTSLLRRFVDKSFNESYLSTIGVHISQKILKSENYGKIELILWDLEGLRAMGGSYPSDYLLGAGAFVFVGDLTAENAMTDVIEVYESVMSTFCIDPVVSFALNKLDLVDSEKEESSLEALKSSQVWSAEKSLFSTSAKVDCNVDSLFQSLALKFK